MKQANYQYEEVDFSQNGLSAEGLRKVLDLCQRCDKLRVLKLYRNDIDDFGAEALADFVRKCHTIEQMHLSHNHFTAVGVESIVRAAAQTRPPHMNPLWLRLEQNDVPEPDRVLRDLQMHLSVCARKDRQRCTVRSCARGCKVHLPHFHFQRGASAAEQWSEDRDVDCSRKKHRRTSWKGQQEWNEKDDHSDWWQSDQWYRGSVGSDRGQRRWKADDSEIRGDLQGWRKSGEKSQSDKRRGHPMKDGSGHSPGAMVDVCVNVNTGDSNAPRRRSHSSTSPNLGVPSGQRRAILQPNEGSLNAMKNEMRDKGHAAREVSLRNCRSASATGASASAREDEASDRQASKARDEMVGDESSEESCRSVPCHRKCPSPVQQHKDTPPRKVVLRQSLTRKSCTEKRAEAGASPTVRRDSNKRCVDRANSLRRCLRKYARHPPRSLRVSMEKRVCRTRDARRDSRCPNRVTRIGYRERRHASHYRRRDHGSRYHNHVPRDRHQCLRHRSHSRRGLWRQRQYRSHGRRCRSCSRGRREKRCPRSRSLDCPMRRPQSTRETESTGKPLGMMMRGSASKAQTTQRIGDAIQDKKDRQPPQKIPANGDTGGCQDAVVAARPKKISKCSAAPSDPVKTSSHDKAEESPVKASAPATLLKVKEEVDESDYTYTDGSEYSSDDEEDSKGKEAEENSEETSASPTPMKQ